MLGSIKEEARLSKLILLLGILSFFLAIWGGIRSYSPVPYWDQWDSYVDFYLNSGNWEAWWLQHNEHRILFSKVLFWIDITLFDAKGYFLIVANYMLQFSSLISLYYVHSKISSVKANVNVSILGILLVLIFSWSQEENFTWGFQSQFFSVYLFALVTLIKLVHLKEMPRDRFVFIYLLIFSFLATFSMANGILIIPFVLIGSVLLSVNKKYTLLIAVWGGLLSVLYFHGLAKVPGSPSVFDNLINYPFELIKYTTLLLGSPFYYILGSKTIASGFGVIYILVCIYLIYTILLKSKCESKYKVGLLLFVGFISASVLATSLGRVHFGLDSATSSRYNTPVLLAWASIIILLKSCLLYRKDLWINYILLLMSVGFLSQQYSVFSSKYYDVKFNRSMALLSVKQGIYDNEFTSKIYPSDSILKKISERGKDLNFPIFSSSSNEERYSIGNNISFESTFECIGNNEEIVTLVNKDFYRIKGWVYNPRLKGIFGIDDILVVDDKGKIVGKGLIGQYRPDVADALNRGNAIDAGWQAYVDARAGQVTVYARYGDRLCKVSNTGFNLPVPDYSTKPYLPSTHTIDDNIIKIYDIKKNNEYAPNGIYHEMENINPKNSTIIGSWVNGDSFNGSISFDLLRLTDYRFIKFIYTTGPSNENQLIELYSKDIVRDIKLPLSHKKWTLFELENKSYEHLTFKDNGSGWGEWNAILLSNENK